MPCSAKLKPLKKWKMRSPGIYQQNLTCDPLESPSPWELLACSPGELAAVGFTEPGAPELHAPSAGELESAFLSALLWVFDSKFPVF